jgi:two-component system, OmpR family, phosphate regulon sensor histidine kinase PhoR
MKSKNTLSLTLMISSLTLLIVLQFLWLKSSYERAFFDFRRETNWLFRGTIYAMRDSLMARNIITFPEDSLPALVKRDTFINRFGGRSRVKVIVSPGDDSTGHELLPPLHQHLQGISVFKDRIAGKAGQNVAIIRLTQDSLNRDSIRILFREALHRAGMDIPFHVNLIHTELTPGRPPGFDDDNPQRGDREIRRSIYRDDVATDHARFSPMYHYQASLGGVQRVILREILPQLLFSVFLTAMIAVVFVMMYRNMRAQQRLMEMKNDFISNITHELKTPMATVSVALEALKSFHVLEKPELTEEYLSMAQSELNRLTLMTDKILKASSFENKGIGFVPEPVNLDAIIRKILSSMKLIFEKRGAVVNYNPLGTDFTVRGSEAHLTNVVYNLVDNALKYGGANPVIDLELKPENNHVDMTVRDRGIGIPREYQKKIFEKFFRVPAGDVHNTKGYGLGLSYVAGVVKGHGGTIAVTSEPDHGSSFIISLPRRHGEN